MKLLKVLALFLGVSASGTLFVFSNISDNYPVDDACSKIRTFGAQHNRYPTLDELDLLRIPDAKLFSTREYRTKGGDFLFYFCKNKLSPCEVCTKSEGPYWDEI